jgi:tetraacyldisaccharide 4'-kinase
VRDGATQPLSELAGQRVHAVTGIASPDRFFRFLTARGIDVLSHPLPDHARIAAHDLLFDDALPVVTTEKDAVKCSRFAHDRLWYLPVDLQWVGEAKGRWLNALNTRLADLFRAQRV